MGRSQGRYLKGCRRESGGLQRAGRAASRFDFEADRKQGEISVHSQGNV